MAIPCANNFMGVAAHSVMEINGLTNMGARICVRDPILNCLISTHKEFVFILGQTDAPHKMGLTYIYFKYIFFKYKRVKP